MVLSVNKLKKTRIGVKTFRCIKIHLLNLKIHSTVGSPQSATLEVASFYRGFGMSKFCSIPFQRSAWRV